MTEYRGGGRFFTGYFTDMEYLVPQNSIDEATESRNSIQDFLFKNILPKLSKEKQERVLEHVSKGVPIDTAMAIEKIRVTSC